MGATFALIAGIPARAGSVTRSRISFRTCPGLTAKQDGNLVNGWGIVAGPTTPFWVSDNGSGNATVYDGTGALKITVMIPAVSGGGPGVPTGVVFNLGASPTSNDFLVSGA